MTCDIWRRTATATASIVALALALVSAQAPQTAQPFSGKVTRLDPALDAVVSPNAKMEVLVTDYFGSSEGPIWVDDGQFLLFSDQAANRIYKWDPAVDKLSVFMENAGYHGKPEDVPNIALFLYNGLHYIQLMGTNGLAIDRQGRLIICARGDRQLVRIEKDGKRTVLADRWQNKKMNAPNDVIVKSDGSIYFVGQMGHDEGRRDMVPNAMFRWKDDKLDLITTDYFSGLAFSPDEKYMYVVSKGALQRVDVMRDGTLANPIPFGGDQGADGVKVDALGNVYVGASDGMRIMSPAGKHIGTIDTGRFTNMVFGDKDHKTLYIVIRRGLARIRMNVAGATWPTAPQGNTR
jgi:gluconolactonase